MWLIAKSRKRAACENCIADNSRISVRTVTKSSSDTSSSTALISISARAAEYIAKRPASDDAFEMNDQEAESLLYSLESKGLLDADVGSLKESANAILSGASHFGPKKCDCASSLNKKVLSVPRGTASSEIVHLIQALKFVTKFRREINTWLRTGCVREEP